MLWSRNILFQIVKLFYGLNGWHQTAVLEEQKNESAEEVDAEDESNTSETKPEAAELDAKSDGFGEKPDINDAPEKENKVIAVLGYFLCYILCDLTPLWILLLFGTNFLTTAENHIKLNFLTF